MPQVSVEDLSRFQARVPGVPVGVFADLTEVQLENISRITATRDFADGELIIQDGDEGDEMYLLLSGKVRVTKKLMMKTGKRVGEAEKEIIVLPAEWNPCFGELALFDSRSIRTATVAGVEDGVCGVIRNEDFIGLANSDHDIGYHVLKNLLENAVGVIRKGNENVLNLTTALSFALTLSG